MLVALVVLLIALLGIALAVVANRSSARWRILVRELIAGIPNARPLTWMVVPGTLTLETALAPSGIAYQTAARALSRGPLLAIIDELRATATDTHLSAKIPLAKLGAPTLRARLKSFFALASALEALPLSEAMGRAFVELPPESGNSARRDAFETLLRWHPRAPEVLRICQTLARNDDDAELRTKARMHLDACAPR